MYTTRISRGSAQLIHGLLRIFFVVGGTANLKIWVKSNLLLVASTIITDFFFAIFPWIIIWNLQMPRQEKITIGCSMSLGLMSVLLMSSTFT